MLRWQLIVGAAALGLALGAVAWWGAGGPQASVARIAPLEARVARLRTPRPPPAVGPADAATVAATPLFILTTGPHAVAPPSLRLDGVSRARGRQAALVSINDQAAEWLGLGDVREGVRLDGVSGAKAVFDTIYGPQEVALGERVGGAATGAPQAAPPSSSAATASAVEPTILDTPPPGFRGPPPPASAPGMRQ